MLQKNKDFKPNSLLLGVGRSWIPLNITRFREIGISHLPIVNQPRRFALQTYSTPPVLHERFHITLWDQNIGTKDGGEIMCSHIANNCLCYVCIITGQNKICVWKSLTLSWPASRFWWVVDAKKWIFMEMIIYQNLWSAKSSYFDCWESGASSWT